MTDKLREIIDGLLLGDGSLVTKKDLVSAYLMFVNKYRDVVDWINKLLFSCGVKGFVKQIKSGYYLYESRSYREFLKEYLRWYKNGKKKIPQDIKISKLSLLLWYLGDGSLATYKAKLKNKIYIIQWIRFSTQGFSKEENEFLAKKLKSLGFEAKVSYTSKAKNQTIIGIYSDNVKKFLDYIGKCPVESLKYRWNYIEKKKEVRRCLKCNKTFIAKTYRHKYCSKKCYFAHYMKKYRKSRKPHAGGRRGMEEA
jgi:hypothetical protein